MADNVSTVKQIYLGWKQAQSQGLLIGVTSELVTTAIPSVQDLLR